MACAAWTLPGLYGCIAGPAEVDDDRELGTAEQGLEPVMDLENCVQGIIRVNGQPIAGAIGRLRAEAIDGNFLYGSANTTGSDGYYISCFNSFPSQSTITVTATYGSLTSTRTVTSLPGIYDFALVAPVSTPRIFGTVRVNGAPAPYHTSVSYQKSDASASGWMQTTDNSGTYGNSSVPAGTYVVSATVYTQPSTTSLTSTSSIVNGDSPTDFNFTIPGFQKGSISGTATLDGAAAANQIVYFKPVTPNGMDQAWKVTSAAGAYALLPVPTGQYTAQMTLNGVTQATNVTLGAGVSTVNFAFVTPPPVVPCCTGTCFVAGTEVTLADGSTRAIEALRLGDSVLAFDVDKGALAASPVTHTFVHPDSDGLVIINGRLRATANHPFYANGRWVRADELGVGDTLVTLPAGATALASGSDVRAMSVSSLAFEPERATTYNIEVADQHTYFAGGALVHNKQQCQMCD